MPTSTAERRIKRTSGFEKDVKRISRKHADFAAAVDRFLDEAARKDVPSGMMIPGVEGKPVYKARLPLGGRGKRGGARLIYYCGTDLVLALYAFSKSDTVDIPVKEIRNALSTLGTTS